MRSALPSPVMPLCLSVGVKSANCARNAAGKCSQKAVVCISCSGIERLPGAHVLHGVKLDLLEADDLAVHAHFAVDAPRAGSGRRALELLAAP